MLHYKLSTVYLHSAGLVDVFGVASDVVLSILMKGKALLSFTGLLSRHVHSS